MSSEVALDRHEAAFNPDTLIPLLKAGQGGLVAPVIIVKCHCDREIRATTAESSPDLGTEQTEGFARAPKGEQLPSREIVQCEPPQFSNVVRGYRLARRDVRDKDGVECEVSVGAIGVNQVSQEPINVDRAAGLLGQFSHRTVLGRLVRVTEAARQIPQTEPGFACPLAKQYVTHLVQDDYSRTWLGVVVRRHSAGDAVLLITVQ